MMSMVKPSYSGVQLVEKQKMPSFNKPSTENNIPLGLHQLFLALPKTDLHLHLSGSTPIYDIQAIMTEKGLSQQEIIEKTTLKDSFKNLDDFLKTYYNVVWCVKTPAHFERAARSICLEAAKENVEYLEIRSSLLNKGGTPDQILEGITKGIKQAQKELASKGFKQEARIIVLAQRNGPPEESLKHAQIASAWAQKPGSLVVGFDVAGSEVKAPANIHKAAIDYAKSHGLKITIHAGETPSSGTLTPTESIQEAIDMGADRLGHALYLLDSPALIDTVIKKGITVESPPRCNVQIGDVASYAEHPIKKMLDAGVDVTLCTDNRTILNTSITREYEELYKNNVITSWKDIKKLVINGAKAAFLPKPEKEALVKTFTRELDEIESKPLYQKVIKSYLSPVKEKISFMGMRIKDLALFKAG